MFTALAHQTIEMIQEGLDYLMEKRNSFKAIVEELEFNFIHYHPFSTKEMLFCAKVGKLKEELMAKAPRILRNEEALVEKQEMVELFTHNMRLLEDAIRTNTASIAALSHGLENTAEDEKKQNLQMRIAENIIDILHMKNNLKVLAIGNNSLGLKIDRLEFAVECAGILRNNIQEHCDKVIAAAEQIGWV